MVPSTKFVLNPRDCVSPPRADGVTLASGEPYSITGLV